MLRCKFVISLMVKTQVLVRLRSVGVVDGGINGSQF